MKLLKLQFLHLFICALAGAFMVLAGAYLYLNPQLPPVETFRNVKLQTPLRIYSEDNVLIAEYGSRRRTPLTLEQIPETYIQAVLSIEDKRFYQHLGVDFISLVNAIRRMVSSGDIQGGASTITMQVARNVSLTRRQSFLRKFKEILLSLKLEQELSKSEILTLYLNLIPFGKRAYGAEAAAQTYYGKTLSQLNLPQLAMLAGIPNAPSAGNPINNPQRALRRRNLVLKRMFDQNNISQQQYEEAVAAPVTASIHSLVEDSGAPWFAEAARVEALRKFGTSVYEDGYRVYTTLNLDMQRKADDALRRGLKSYDLRHGYRGSQEQLPVPEELKRSLVKRITDPRLPAEWKEKLQSIQPYSNLVPAIVAHVQEQSFDAFLVDGSLIKVNRDGFKWARRLIDANKRGQEPPNASFVVQPGFVIWLEEADKQWFLRQIPLLQGAVIVLEPQNGAVRAITGGSDFKRNQFNNALRGKRQPGSSFKPFVYAAALEQGVTPATVFNDAPMVFEDQNLEGRYRPRNSTGDFRGPTLAREAFYRSINLVSMRVLLAAGVEPTLDLLSRFGFDTRNFPDNLQLAVGGGTLAVTPMEMTRAYSVFSNGGYLIEPYLIKHIEQNEAGVVFRHRAAVACNPCPSGFEEDMKDDPVLAKRVLDARIAFQMKSLMKDVIKLGTGRRAQVLERDDLAGKTGTTDEADVWFNGFNKDLVASVWLGFADHSKLGDNEFGSNLALPVWIDVMSQILPAESPEAENPPSGLVQVHIDPLTGAATHPGYPKAVPEWFRVENAPRQSNNAVIQTEEESGIDPTELF